MASEEQLTVWPSGSVEFDGQRARMGRWVAKWWLMGPVTFVLSVLIFGRGGIIAPQPSAPIGEPWAGPAGAGLAHEEIAWLSGAHTSDTAVKDYGWATSPLVASKHGGTVAQIKISCGADWAFVSLEFAEAPEFLDATPIGGGYNRINASVAWDGQTDSVQFLQEKGSKTISFADEQATISKLAAASTMLLTLALHDREPTELEFPLKGSSAAIEDMWSSCR